MGNNYWMDSAFCSRHLVPQKVGNIIFVCYALNMCLLFSQYFLKSKSPHFSEKSNPGLPRLEPHRKVSATELENNPQTFKTLRKTANLFSNLDFLPKSEFPKTLDLSMDSPRIFHGFPTPWIFGEAAGAADKSLGRAL